nr:TetR/AcrR family transcriptional regulator [Oceanococcus sp. HetDA_MAG_MS8]
MQSAKQTKPYSTSRSYHGKSAEARRRARREKLIAAGIQLIGTQGFASTSLNALCQEAGLTKRYFYESFESMEALLTAAFGSISEALQQHVIRHINAHSQPKAMIEAGFRGFFEYIQAHPEQGRVYLVEALSVHSLRHQLLGSGGGEVSAFLLQTTQQYLPKDAPVAPEILAIIAQGAVGAAVFVGQNWIASDFEQPMEELVTAVSEICFGIAQRLNIPLDRGRHP